MQFIALFGTPKSYDQDLPSKEHIFSLRGCESIVNKLNISVINNKAAPKGLNDSIL